MVVRVSAGRGTGWWYNVGVDGIGLTRVTKDDGTGYRASGGGRELFGGVVDQLASL